MIMQILLSRCTSPKYAYMARLIDKPQALAGVTLSLIRAYGAYPQGSITGRSVHLNSDSIVIWFDFQMGVRERPTRTEELQRGKRREARFSRSPGLKSLRVRHAKLHEPWMHTRAGLSTDSGKLHCSQYL